MIAAAAVPTHNAAFEKPQWKKLDEAKRKALQASGAKAWIECLPLPRQ